jgi:hypothetical protein
MRPRLKRLMWLAPVAILGMVLFTFIGGEIVLQLWNWLLPPLFGWRELTFWQALGMLVLCRILFGGFGMSGSGHNSHRRAGRRISERVSERLAERMEHMTPEERERFRQGMRERWAFRATTEEGTGQ